MKQFFQKNWLILTLALILILIFVFGGMYFRHVVYTEQSITEPNINHTLILDSNILNNIQTNNTLILESKEYNSFISVDITFIDFMNGGVLI